MPTNHDDYQPQIMNIDQATLGAMARIARSAGGVGMTVELHIKHLGIEVYVIAGDVVHRLVTDRGRPRSFKSPSTVLSFLAAREIKCAAIMGIDQFRRFEHGAE